MKLADYVFPSLKKLGKLPSVDVVGNNRINLFCRWFIDSGLSQLVPPIWQDFVIRFNNYYPAEFGRKPFSEDVVLIVHYSEDKTAFAVCTCVNGKKVFTAVVNYAEQIGNNLKVTLQCAESNRHLAEHHCMSACTAVLAVQSYILYHKPEAVFVESVPSKRASMHSPNAKVSAIRSTVHHYVRIEESDAIPKPRHYNAIQWQVRGHYRRLFNSDGSVKRLTYIAPHMAKRGNKKAAAKALLLPDESKED